MNNIAANTAPSDPMDPPATIMLVDDTPANLNLLEQMLRAQGYRVLAFPKGALALRAAAKSPPDLILLDIMMPEMDGFEVCCQLKADAALKDIPVIFISALSETPDKIRAFAAGGVDYVTKPFQEEEVLARVGAHLNIVFLQRQLQAHNQNLEHRVARRTRELARAQQRLLELSQIKNDFLSMISHEMRTPANGVLGIGNILIDLCPPSEERNMFADLFHQAGTRLQNLIDDTLKIATLEETHPPSYTWLPLTNIVNRVQAELPKIRLVLNLSSEVLASSLYVDPALLIRALSTIIRLANCFSRDKETITLSGAVAADQLELRLELDALTLTPGQTATFFNVESPVRSASYAEDLALAPVVAHRIIAAFGGNLRLIKGENAKGVVAVQLPVGVHQAE